MEFNPEKIKLIIGLGNPDKRYDNTYHNVGYLFIDFLTKSLKLKAKSLKSDTYMNESGKFIARELKKRGIKPEELLVVHDDSDITLGEYKFSFGRGAAGHHGIESVIRALKTKDCWRIRIGIRREARKKASEFVLKKISAKDKKTLNETIKLAAEKLKAKSLKLKTTVGFTLIELLIYLFIFTMVLTSFMAIFLHVLRIQNRQAAVTEVINQSQFIIQRIQQLVRKSDEINIPSGSATSTLTLVMSDSELNPTVIRLDGTDVKLKQGTGQELKLNSLNVVINELNFTKYDLPPLGGNPNKGFVSTDLQISYDSDNNPQLEFSITVRSAAAPLLYK